MSSNADLIDTIAANDREAHFRHSVLRERIVEHLFIGEALRVLWTRDIFDAEILRSEFDASCWSLSPTRRSGSTRAGGRRSSLHPVASWELASGLPRD